MSKHLQSVAPLCKFNFSIKSSKYCLSHDAVNEMTKKHKEDISNLTLKIIYIENGSVSKMKPHHEWTLILTDGTDEMIGILRNNNLRLIANDIICIQQYQLIGRGKETLLQIITYKFIKHDS